MPNQLKLCYSRFGSSQGSSNELKKEDESRAFSSRFHRPLKFTYQQRHGYRLCPALNNRSIVRQMSGNGDHTWPVDMGIEIILMTTVSKGFLQASACTGKVDIPCAFLKISTPFPKKPATASIIQRKTGVVRLNFNIDTARITARSFRFILRANKLVT